MLKLKLTAEAVLLANKKFGGVTARLAPEFAPAGAIRLTLQSSSPVEPPPVKNMHVTAVADVVVNEKA